MITQLFSGLFRLDLGYILDTSPHNCNFFTKYEVNYYMKTNLLFFVLPFLPATSNYSTALLLTVCKLQ